MLKLELAQAVAMVALVRRGTELVAALDRGADADELLVCVVAAEAAAAAARIAMVAVSVIL